MSILNFILLTATAWTAICLAVWWAFLRNVPITDDDSTFGEDSPRQSHRAPWGDA